MATHSSTLAWKIPWTEEPGRLQSMGSQRVGHDWFHFHYAPHMSMSRQNDKIWKEELPRLVGAQYAPGDQWRNNSRKNEGMEPKQKQYPVVDGTGDRNKVRNKVRCCKEEYCIGTWNVRSMNQSKLEVVKQEMARVNVSHFRNQQTKMDWNGWI